MFTNQETWKDLLLEMFLPRKQWGQVLIPCGVHTLKCTKAEWRVGKQKRYLYVELWKKPEYHPYAKEKVSYGKLKLYHIPTFFETSGGNWYERFTTTLNEQFLEHLRERLSAKPEFQAVVGRVEIERVEPTAGGELHLYHWENFIRSVHRVDEQVELTNEDYFDLYRPVLNKKNDAAVNDLPPEETDVPF